MMMKGFFEIEEQKDRVSAFISNDDGDHVNDP